VSVLYVALGAAAGAPLRYLADLAIQRRHDSVFPWGTLVVNIAGSFLFGLVVALAGGGDLGTGMVAGLGVGFCGALTTYSTFGYETLRLVEGGARFYALANIGVSVAAGLGAASVGWTLGTALA
jgi:fluoride exporter